MPRLPGAHGAGQGREAPTEEGSLDACHRSRIIGIRSVVGPFEQDMRRDVYSPNGFPLNCVRDTLGGGHIATSTRKSTGTVADGAPQLDAACRYLVRVAPTSADERGDVHTFRVYCPLVRCFALATGGATALNDWNARCQPLSAEYQTRRKLARLGEMDENPLAALVRT